MPAEQRSRPNRVREHREAAGLTQGALAEQAGIGRVTLIRTEQGSQTPSLPAAIALAEALDVTLDELFGDEGRETPGQAYWRGRREGEHDARRAEADTPADSEVASDPWGIAAKVSELVQRPPSAPDARWFWWLPNPRGTARKLDAIVVVNVYRQPPRESGRLWAYLADEADADAGVDADTDRRS